MVFKSSTGERLDRAIAGLRAAAAEEAELFAGTTRSRILRDALSASRDDAGPLAPLFAPFRAMATAAGVPALALSLVLGVLALQLGPEPLGRAVVSSDNMTARKVGNNVVFKLPVRDREHRLLRATQPEFDRTSAIDGSDGRFSVRLDGDARLVFYRIE